MYSRLKSIINTLQNHTRVKSGEITREHTTTGGASFHAVSRQVSSKQVTAVQRISICSPEGGESSHVINVTLIKYLFDAVYYNAGETLLVVLMSVIILAADGFVTGTACMATTPDKDCE